jgi:hypothetical protein
MRGTLSGVKHFTGECRRACYRCFAEARHSRAGTIRVSLDVVAPEASKIFR